MNKIIFALVMLIVLPAMAIAEEKSEAAAKADPKVHTMQNSDPTPDEKAAKPEHTMQNSNPSPAKKAEKPEHVMKNN